MYHSKALTAKQRLALLLDEDEIAEMTRKPEPAVQPISQPTPQLDVADDDPYHGLTEEMRDHWNTNSDDDEPAAASSQQHDTSSPYDPDWKPNMPTSSEFAAMTGNDVPIQRPPVGTLVQAGESFIPLMTLSKFPYKHIKNREVGQQIASNFFDAGKFWQIHWDM